MIVRMNENREAQVLRDVQEFKKDCLSKKKVGRITAAFFDEYTDGGSFIISSYTFTIYKVVSSIPRVGHKSMSSIRK